MNKNSTEKEYTFEGCYGNKANVHDLKKFLLLNFKLNEINEEKNINKFPVAVWGHSGIGKTSVVKDLKSEGYTVVEVPIAQMEEMGDLHGIPMDCLRMVKDNNTYKWVPQKDSIINAFMQQDWQIDIHTQPRTIMSPPDWVPLTAGKTILLLDDWNRASIRILKGIMQLLQNFGMVSWKLPKGCQIVLTGNPDEQDYLVTTIDQAILTRIKHITLKFDPKPWTQWAQQQKLDPRVINYVLSYPEMLTKYSKTLTNPRTIAEFGRYLSTVDKNIYNKNVSKDSSDSEITHGIIPEVYNQALSLLDIETISSLFVYLTREVEDIIEPEDILDGKSEVYEYFKELKSRIEPRIDIIGITTERLLAKLLDPDTEQSERAIKNLQKFLESDILLDDMRYVFCQRLVKTNPNPDTLNKNSKWLLGSKILANILYKNLRDID